jgi:hypothetical protein
MVTWEDIIEDEVKKITRRLDHRENYFSVTCVETEDGTNIYVQDAQRLHIICHEWIGHYLNYFISIDINHYWKFIEYEYFIKISPGVHDIITERISMNDPNCLDKVLLATNKALRINDKLNHGDLPLGVRVGCRDCYGDEPI